MAPKKKQISWKTLIVLAFTGVSYWTLLGTETCQEAQDRDVQVIRLRSTEVRVFAHNLRHLIAVLV